MKHALFIKKIRDCPYHLKRNIVRLKNLSRTDQLQKAMTKRVAYNKKSKITKQGCHNVEMKGKFNFPMLKTIL